MKLEIVNNEEKRKRSIIDDSPAIFEIKSNPDAVGIAPTIEISSQSQVKIWSGLIVKLAKKHDVDSRLVMAIMYMETTHGWYDKLYPDWLEERFPMRRSVLPMNIHYRYWRKLGVTKELVKCPHYNIEFGVILLSRIKKRIKEPTIAKIASIYNFVGAEKVTDYGARVARIYKIQPWSRVKR